jgi:hypothetical protein
MNQKSVRPFGVQYLETLKVATGVQAGVLTTQHISVNSHGKVIDRG